MPGGSGESRGVPTGRRLSNPTLPHSSSMGHTLGVAFTAGEWRLSPQVNGGYCRSSRRSPCACGEDRKDAAVPQCRGGAPIRVIVFPSRFHPGVEIHVIRGAIKLVVLEGVAAARVVLAATALVRLPAVSDEQGAR